MLPADNLERKSIEKILSANEMLSDFYEADPLPARVIAEELVVLAQFLAPLVVNPYKVLRGVREGTESALCEGAQGTMLDIDHGTFPYVTSSNSTIGGALTGTGLPPRALGEINGVFKAYCTRVGNGPFPSELLGEQGDGLREAGRRVRRHHRPRPPLRLVRPGGRPLRRGHQRHDRRDHHQAGRAGQPAHDPGGHRLRGRRPAPGHLSRP